MKILIIEDDSAIIDNLTLTFKVGWPEVELIWTSLGEEGIEFVESESPDMIILDLSLPDISGFEVLKEIRSFSNIPVLILTVREEETSVVKAFDLGADEYIVKPFRQMEILARLKSIAHRRNVAAVNTYQKCGPFYFNASTNNVKINEREIYLTKSEFLLLHHLATNQGKVLTYSSIAESIWGNDYPDSSKAVRVYIRQLRKKIEADPGKPEIILNKPRIGYLLA